jgi:mRNA interferase MazF
VVAVTSNPETTDYSFTITSSDLESGTLKRPSRVRIDKIYTLSQSMVVKTFGRVNATTLEKIRKTLLQLASNKS